MGRTFVGFGFGPIQAGLFLAEAHRSGNFDRLVVAEVLPEVVAAVQAAGAYAVNIGHSDGIAVLRVQPVEMHLPQTQAGQEALIAAIAAAEEMATALPSVEFYTRGEPNSTVAGLLAAGLRRKAAQQGPPAVVYAAENHTRAAELLQAAVAERVPLAERATVLSRVQFLETVIGKMSGAPETTDDLAPVAPGLARAFLVEAFNRILVSRIRRPGDAVQHALEPALDPAWASYRRGIEVFVEKPDLRPFAEAKLYGHNAGHALAAYLAAQLGFTRIDELTQRPDVLRFVADAMLRESGAPLCLRWAGADPLFTADGFRAYAEDLVQRMVNPYVRDTVARVGRDPARKLGWEDRLVGAMRLALSAGIRPQRYALGAAAALRWLGLEPAAPAPEVEATLRQLWLPDNPPQPMATQVAGEVVQAWPQLRQWAEAGFPRLETMENSR